MSLIVTMGTGQKTLIPGTDYGRTFADIITYFTGTTYSLYDFRPGAVYSDNAGTIVINSAGTPVANVLDLGTAKRHLARGAPSQRPTSGSVGIVWDGTDRTMVAAGGLMNVKTVVAVFSANTLWPGSAGIVTNFNDTSANVDYVFSRAGGSNIWDTAQGVGFGLADKDHFWRNSKTIDISIPVNDQLICWSADGTGFTGNTNFLDGLKIGNDRNNGSRNWSGNLAALFIMGDRILNETDRNYVEYTFNYIFGLNF